MNRKRLNQLIETVKKIPLERFDMGAWLEKDSRHPCNTTGCLAGWHSQFNPRIQLKVDESGPMLKGVKDSSGYDIQGTTALAKYFDITDDAAHYLFFGTPEFLGKPNEVRRRLIIERIESVIKNAGHAPDEEDPL